MRLLLILFLLFFQTLAQGRDFTIETVPFQLSDQTTLNASLLLPKREKNHNAPLPILYLFGGFEKAAEVLSLVRPKVDVAVASFDYPFSPPRKFHFPKSFSFAPEAKRAILSTLEGINVLNQKLSKRKDLDTSEATIIGASFGAPFATIAASKNPKLKNLVLIHGMADVPGTLQHVMVKSWSRKIGALSKPAAWIIAKLGWFYVGAPNVAEAAAGLRKTQRALYIEAENDTRIPKPSRTLLLESLRRSQAKIEHVSMTGDHLAPGATDLINELIDRVTLWMTHEGLIEK